MRWSGHAAYSGRRGIHPGFERGNLAGKRPHGLPRHIWEGNVKTDLEQMDWEGLV